MFIPLEFIEYNGRTATPKAIELMQTDPHGLSLAAVAITVVFTCLLILFGVYSLSGAIFSGRLKKKKLVQSAPSPDNSGEIAAAIGLALHMYMVEHSHHEEEPGFITISSSENSSWADKSRNFRKRP